MRCHQTFALCLLLVGLSTTTVFGQSRKFVIAVIGSSTSQGVGANPIDSSYVNLTKAYFKGLGLIDTIYNIALGGTTTYAGMPTGFKPPANRQDSAFRPDTSTNVTKALSFNPNPDVVIVNFPTNDAAAGLTLTETMFNLRTIYKTITDDGKIAFVTTSQPRTSLDSVSRQLLKRMRDSVLKEFTTFSLNFYNPIVAADSLTINPLYNFDGTHVNNAGHQLLFQVVKNANILSGIVPLPLTLLNFTARTTGSEVALQWTITDETAPPAFVVQRSNDEKTFDDIPATPFSAPAASTATSTWSWTDDNPLPGRSYYRLKYTEDTRTAYSEIVAVNSSAAKWGIGKLIAAAGAANIQAEILSPVAKTAAISVLSSTGELIYRRVVALSSPSVMITIPTSGWASGQYFLHLVTDQGDVATKAFLKF